MFLAEDLQSGQVAREATEQDMEHRWVTEQEFRQLVRASDVVDGASLAAYSLLGLDRLEAER